MVVFNRHLDDHSQEPPADSITGVLDEVRGLLSSLANRGRAFLEPISSIALSGALRRRSRDVDVVLCLERLHKIGDVQRLPGGYWLPAPTTLVKCAELYAVVSGWPTTWLSETFGAEVTQGGIGRVIQVTAVPDPRHLEAPFVAWCRAPDRTDIWTEDFIKEAPFSTVELGVGLEIFNHWDSVSGTRWGPYGSLASAPKGIAYGRKKDPFGARVYFLIRSNSEGIVDCMQVPREQGTHHRLKYGLLALAGQPQEFLALEYPSHVRVKLPRHLPDPEDRLLDAIGRVTLRDEDWYQIVEIPNLAWPQVEKVLYGLGFVRETAK